MLWSLNAGKESLENWTPVLQQKRGSGRGWGWGRSVFAVRNKKKNHHFTISPVYALQRNYGDARKITVHSKSKNLIIFSLKILWGKIVNSRLTKISLKNWCLLRFFAGPEKADLIIRLPVGAFNVVFLMRKASNNYLGEKQLRYQGLSSLNLPEARESLGTRLGEA